MIGTFGMKMSVMSLIGLLSIGPLRADPVSEPPEPWKERVTAVPELDLGGVDAASRAELLQARSTLSGLLISPQADVQAVGDAYGRLGALYQVHNVSSAAGRCYRNAIRHSPKNFRWPYYHGELLRNGGRHQEALESYARALALNPDYPALTLRRAQSMIELGRMPQARDLLKTIEDSSGLEAAVQYELARIAQSRKDHRQAVEHLRKALQLEPRAERLHYPLAQALRALGEAEQAREHLAHQGRDLPTVNDPLVDELNALKRGSHSHYRRAMAAVEKSDYAQAAQAFEQGLAMDAGNANARISYARVLYAGGRREAAQEQLEKVLSQDSDSPLAAFLLGILVDQAGDAERAEALYRRALSSQPRHAGANYYLASQQFRSGAYAQAARHFGIARESNPDIAIAAFLQLLAQWYAGRPDAEIVVAMEQLTSARPQDPQPRYALCLMLAASQDRQVQSPGRALELAEALAEEMPMPLTLALLARAHAANGEHRQAEALSRQLDTLPYWTQGIESSVLRADLQAYRNHEVPASVWRPFDPMLQAPPPLADGPMRDYPAALPY